MKNFIIMIGMVLFVIQLPSISYAQAKKEKIELECGCEITPTTLQCGKCGGFLKPIQHKDNVKLFDYKCSNPRCPHKHENLRYDDYFGHTHVENVCLKRQRKIVDEAMMLVYITNICPRNRSLFIKSITSKSAQGETVERVYQLLPPQETLHSRTLFPKSDYLKVEIRKD